MVVQADKYPPLRESMLEVAVFPEATLQSPTLPRKSEQRFKCELSQFGYAITNGMDLVHIMWVYAALTFSKR
jgi:hypothetical protein